MASPQKEHGYTPIAHEILEALGRMKLTSYEWNFVMILLRKTWGFGKREDWITGSQFVGLMGAKKERVSEAKRGLLDKKVVTEIRNKLSLNKDYDKWVKLRKTVTRVTENRNKKLRKSVNTIDKPIDNRYTPSGVKKNMAFKKYSENNHSDSEEIQLDAESGEKVKSSQDKALEKVRELMAWAEDRKGQKFIQKAKQYVALKKMRLAKISPKEIQQRWMELENTDFGKKVGIDFMSVLNSFDKKR